MRPLTQFHVLVYHARHFTKLVLDEDEEPALEFTIGRGAINILLNLRHIVVRAIAAQSLFRADSDDLDDSPPPPIATAFRDVFRKIRRLNVCSAINATHAEDASALISCAPLADVVDISGPALSDTAGSIGLALSQLAHLQELNVDLRKAKDVGCGVTSTWAKLQWVSPPKRLSLAFPALGAP